jgi:hypothetical protein
MEPLVDPARTVRGIPRVPSLDVACARVANHAVLSRKEAPATVHCYLHKVLSLVQAEWRRAQPIQLREQEIIPPRTLQRRRR